MERRLWFLFFVSLFTICMASTSQNPFECRHPPKRKELEIFGWSWKLTAQHYRFYPHENITHLTIGPGDGSFHKNQTAVFEAIHFLHQKGIRVQMPLGNPSLDVKQLQNEAYRAKKIQQWIDTVKLYCYDGISFDVESPMYSNETRNAYVELVKEGRSALKEIDSSMETSMAVPFNPEPLGCVTGRCKYWANMAEYMDQVFVMGYDSQDNVLVASATAPLNVIETGLQAYIALGIQKSKLILGVPWYSFVYPCVFIPKHQNPIKPCFVNFAARHEEDISVTLDLCHNQALDGNHYDEESHTYYCTTRNLPQDEESLLSRRLRREPWMDRGSGYQQRWFDTPETLNEKYQMALRNGVRGFGMWYMDSVKYPLSENPMTQKFWNVMVDAAKTPVDSENEAF